MNIFRHSSLDREIYFDIKHVFIFNTIREKFKGLQCSGAKYIYKTLLQHNYRTCYYLFVKVNKILVNNDYKCEQK